MIAAGASPSPDGYVEWVVRPHMDMWPTALAVAAPYTLGVVLVVALGLLWRRRARRRRA